MIITEYRLRVPDWAKGDNFRHVSAKMLAAGGIYVSPCKGRGRRYPTGWLFEDRQAAEAAEQILAALACELGSSEEQ